MPKGVGAVGMSNAGRFSGTSTTIRQRYFISGVTRDTSGAALGGCTVDIFETATNLFRGQTISDASGNYAIEVAGDLGLTFFANAYLAGVPDKAGATLNTLVGS